MYNLIRYGGLSESSINYFLSRMNLILVHDRFACLIFCMVSKTMLTISVKLVDSINDKPHPVADIIDFINVLTCQ